MRARAVDEVITHWPTECDCGHVFLVADRVAIGEPARRQVEELPVMAVRVTEPCEDAYGFASRALRGRCRLGTRCVPGGVVVN